MIKAFWLTYLSQGNPRSFNDLMAKGVVDPSPQQVFFHLLSEMGGAFCELILAVGHACGI